MQNFKLKQFYAVFLLLFVTNDYIGLKSNVRQAAAQYQPRPPLQQPQLQQQQQQKSSLTCFNNPCKNNARCVNGPNNSGYTCMCMPPWSGLNCDQSQQQPIGGINNIAVTPSTNVNNGKQLIGVQPGFYTMFTQPIYNTNIANGWNIAQDNRPQPAQNPASGANYQGGGGMPILNNPGYRPSQSIYGSGGGYGGYGQQNQQPPLMPNFNNPYGFRPTPPGYGQQWGQQQQQQPNFYGGQNGYGQYGYGCQSMPCKNGASCIPDSNPLGYRCLCVDDYDGFNCENYNLSRGAKLGIILGTVIPGVIVIVAVVAILIYFLVIRKKRQQKQDSSSSSSQKQRLTFPNNSTSTTTSSNSGGKKVTYKNVPQNDV